MNYVWPKIQAYLGGGKLLDEILDQWKMGCLGCKFNKNHAFSGP